MGRPRTTTRVSAKPPTSIIGTPDPYAYGLTTISPMTGEPASWHHWLDLYEYVPEIRWPYSVWLYDQMRTDSQLAALITAVMYGVRQLRWVLDPNGARNSLITEISQDLNVPILGKDGDPKGRMKRRFTLHTFLSQALLSVIYGFYYFEQNGEIIDGKWRLRKMFPIDPHSIQRINVDDEGALVSVQQWINSVNVRSFPMIGEPIPVSQLCAFIFEREGHSWVGRSMMRDCYKDYLVKDRLMRVEAINHERAGGVPYANAPQGATPDEVQDLDMMMRSFRIGETSGGALPFGAELNIARGSGSDIDKTITRYNESMARRFLAQLFNLAQSGQHVGSYALSENFEDSFLVGQRTIAQWVCDTVNEHIIEDIADWNYGEDEENVPLLTWERMSEDSLGVEQLATLVQRGVIIVDDELENRIRYKYQLPQRTGPRPEELMGPGLPRTQPQEAPPGTPSGTGISQETGGQSGAPSSGTPVQSNASFWQRLTRQKPDVAASDGPSLVTVPNIEILHAGIEYRLSTGPTTFTPEDLRDAVTAANEDSSIPAPRLKLGHVDPRYNDDKTFDATPSFGKAKNLRLSENGMAVYADYVGVPAWLAEILPYAFPSRSVEGYWDVPSQKGKHWRFVLSACSLLGVTWPGVTVLEDLPQYYGKETPEDVVIDPQLVAAIGGEDVKLRRKGTAASANLDDVRRAFYKDYLLANPAVRGWWVQAVYLDPNEIVVEDDETGKLYKISFASDTEGKVQFGDAEPVRIEYVPDTRDANLAAAAHVAATLAIGRTVLASWDKREDSVLPTTASGGAMDPKEIRERLGLSEDASDEQVQETLQELNEAAGSGTSAGHDPATTGGVTPAATGAPTPETPVGDEPLDPTSAKAPAATLPPGMVLIDQATLDTLKTGASVALEQRNDTLRQRRESLVTASIADGKIAPAARDAWLGALEQSDKVGDTSTAAALEAMPRGLIPVELRGTAPPNPEGVAAGVGDIELETVHGWTDQLFPDVGARRRREQTAAAAGEPVHHSRISADANYRR